MRRNALHTQAICLQCSFRTSQYNVAPRVSRRRQASTRSAFSDAPTSSLLEHLQKADFVRDQVDQVKNDANKPSGTRLHRVLYQAKGMGAPELSTSFSTFANALHAELDSLSGNSDKFYPRASLGLHKPDHRKAFDSWILRLKRELVSWIESGKDPESGQFPSEAQKDLYHVYRESGRTGLGGRLRHTFQEAMATKDFSPHQHRKQENITDMRFPAQWYPRARMMDREIHLHIGPTNSGKTYQALQRLQQARRGVYAGPLRLLAHEVYFRMVAAGRSCNMVTGDERIVSDDPDCGLVSCTVEMAPSSIEYDVAVIDEIQMISDVERGWAWTEAFLGLRAKELHICGEERSLSLIRQLAASTGDKLIVHEYKRLSPLSVSSEPVGLHYENLRPGDCIVAFSRNEIHEIRNRITQVTGRKCAVIYGSLPPETRAEQARLFNDPDSGYDILVASNAIGMGLNLSIKRIVFTAISKWNGLAFRNLHTSEVKQIGGRAGRFRVAPASAKSVATNNDKASSLNEGGGQLSARDLPKPADAEQSMGLVTTLYPQDLDFVEEKMSEELEPLRQAVIMLPDKAIMRYAAYFPAETSLAFILRRISQTATLGEQFRIAHLEQNIQVANVIVAVRNLKLEDQLTFVAAPVRMESHLARRCLIAMAECVANSKPADLFDMPMRLSLLKEGLVPSSDMLKTIEELHSCLTLYLWLSYRFIGLFPSQAVAKYARSMAQMRINEILTALVEAGKIKASVRFQRGNKLPSSPPEKREVTS